MTDTLDCFPTGCSGCYHATSQGTCGLAETAWDNGFLTNVTLTGETGSARPVHPIEATPGLAMLVEA